MKLSGAFAATLTVQGCASPTLFSGKPAKRPNILFLFADDMTFEAIHAFGSEVETPNLDKLVKNGVTFTHAYNQGAWHGAVCVASRTMLNTGRFLWNAKGVEKTLGEEKRKGRFWSQYMKQAGYDTYYSGKWHVKTKVNDLFDFTSHVRPGMPKSVPQAYNRPHEGKPDAWKAWDPSVGGYWEGGKHWSEVLGDDGTRFIQQAAAKDNPFFMYLAFNAPHDPRQSPKEFVDKYPLDEVDVPENFLPEYPYKDAIGCSKRLRDEKLGPFPRTEYAVKVHRQEYYAIITHMDAQVGRILDALEKQGLDKNTYVFFTADHGLACGHHGLMGKQNMYDHSVRVPLMVMGPGVGRGTVESPVYLQDIMPTTLELAGAEIPPQVQFKSLLGSMQGKGGPYDAVYGGYMNSQRMVTDDGYKMILYPKIKKVRLFDLKQDPEEMTDLGEDKKYDSVKKTLFAKLLSLQTEIGDALDLKAIYPNLCGE
ncbi:MAG: sulfatase-like hydrolase/transferase [Planctomycetota bacterium]